MENIKIFSGTSNFPLSEAVCKYLGVPLGRAEIRRFSDGEVFVEIAESVRRTHVFVIQSTCPPVNENIMELLIITDALKRASAKAITAVIPYYGYARQDRKVQPRAPISAKLVADIIVKAGVSRVVTMDLHAGQIQGFFDVPVDHLYAAPVLIDYIKNKFRKDEIVIVSPDAGGMERARAYAKRLGTGLAMTDKRRPAPNEAEIMNVIGDVKGKIAIIVDDLVDTGGTAIQAAQALIREGAKGVTLCCTHGVLSGNAIKKIEDSPLEEVIITDTIPPREEAKRSGKIKVLSIASLLGEAIRRIAIGESISTLFT
ncbi:MAG: ribose-phosphate pyrophosphokinase [Deltaproteobacteria bacterium]|jgi:ribose-phosphate pyrophosphokinase|nr:MAG: ribose-phosphate pyrophosphokinase [Deltaproteobacteria bacterium]